MIQSEITRLKDDNYPKYLPGYSGFSTEAMAAEIAGKRVFRPSSGKSQKAIEGINHELVLEGNSENITRVVEEFKKLNTLFFYFHTMTENRTEKGAQIKFFSARRWDDKAGSILKDISDRTAVRIVQHIFI